MKGTLLKILLVSIGLTFVSQVVVHAAQKYPVKPIECIVGLEAGADGDVMTRPIVQKVSQVLGQPIMIVNKPGAGSTIGYRLIHDAKPDGYTIGWGSNTIITSKMQGIFPYDHNDFVQLGSLCAIQPIVIASTKSKHLFKTIQEVISFSKANPGEVTMATSGVGQTWWIGAMCFIEETGINVNTIPQPGTGAMVTAQVAGGHTDLGVVAVGSAKAMIDSGQVRFLANLGDQRALPPYDQYPTMKELGYDVSWESTSFLMAPPRFPKQYQDIWVKAIKDAVHDPEYRKFVTERNTRLDYISPEQINAVFDKRGLAVREIIKKAGIIKAK